MSTKAKNIYRKIAFVKCACAEKCPKKIITKEA